MPALPPASDFTGAARTEGQAKSFITDVRAFLAGLLGTTGVPADALAALNVKIAPRLTIWMPAAGMASRTTNGAVAASRELATNKQMLRTLNFADGTKLYGQFQIKMPKGWNLGTLLARFVWTQQSGAGNVVFGIQAVAASDDDALDAAFGAAVEVTDSPLTANDSHASALTGAMTVAGALSAGDLVTFQVYRDPANVADTFTGAAELVGVELLYDVTTTDDA